MGRRGGGEALRVEPRTGFELVVQTRLDGLTEQVNRVETWVKAILGTVLVAVTIELVRAVNR